MLVDTHCHFNHEQFVIDSELAIARAGVASVTRMIVVGFDLESSGKAVSLAVLHDKTLFAAVGVHPHDAKTWNSAAAHQLEAWAAEPGVCAIGEIGLDYYRDLSPRPLQKSVFREQLRIARNINLPVIIHCRDAYDDTLQILFEERVQDIGGVMHCWAGTLADAKRTLDLGMHLGFGGTITYKNADNVREALKSIPLEAVLLETDAPYLSPIPYRGKRNEPAYVRIVAEAAAELRGISFEDIETATTQNAIRCFPKLGNAARRSA